METETRHRTGLLPSRASTSSHFLLFHLTRVHCVHRVPKKTKQICFCQNFVKFPPISIIFGTKMGNDPNICGAGEFQYAIRIFKGAKGVAMATKFKQK